MLFSLLVACDTCPVSAKGGVDNAVKMAAQMSARAFSFFVRPQRTWKAKPLEPEVSVFYMPVLYKTQDANFFCYRIFLDISVYIFKDN